MMTPPAENEARPPDRSGRGFATGAVILLALLLAAGAMWLGWKREERVVADRAAQLAEIERRALANELESERLVLEGALSALRAAQERIDRLESGATPAVTHVRLLAPPDGAGPLHGVVVWHAHPFPALAEVAPLPVPESGETYELWLRATDEHSAAKLGPLRREGTIGYLQFEPPVDLTAGHWRRLEVRVVPAAPAAGRAASVLLRPIAGPALRTL